MNLLSVLPPNTVVWIISTVGTACIPCPVWLCCSVVSLFTDLSNYFEHKVIVTGKKWPQLQTNNNNKLHQVVINWHYLLKKIASTHLITPFFITIVLSSMRKGWMIIPSSTLSENLHKENKLTLGYLDCFSFPHSLETDRCDMARVIVRCSWRPWECRVPLIVPREISSPIPWEGLSGVQLSAQMGAGLTHHFFLQVHRRAQWSVCLSPRDTLQDLLGIFYCGLKQKGWQGER